MNDHSIRKGDSYTLSPFERDEIKAIARERTASNRRAGVRDSGIGPSSGLFKDMIGAAGEFAFAKLANSEFDYSISPRSFLRGEDRGDTSFLGIHIDIKSTHYRSGKLVVVPWRDGANDSIYGLMVMISRSGPTFQFKGFADAMTVKAHPNDLGHGFTYAVPQKKLLEWWEIEAFPKPQT